MQFATISSDDPFKIKGLEMIDGDDDFIELIDCTNGSRCIFMVSLRIYASQVSGGVFQAESRLVITI